MDDKLKTIFKYDGIDLFIYDSHNEWRKVDKLFTELFCKDQLYMEQITEQEAFLEIL